MKKKLQILIYLIIVSKLAVAQITTPVIRANFGVDADLRSNFFNGLVQSGNDDWFRLPGSSGTGEFVIDTTGATAIVAGYTSDPNSRKLPFFRNMRFSPYTTVNNRILIDAVFVRDYHGDDSTIFASGSNKNGMSPANWTCPVSQSIPDKNEILDMMLHVRKAGPNVTDSLWLFAGLSIESTTGNRYFDFEMYQTDIYYDRASRSFYNYGPDAGHTTWRFNTAGVPTSPGDIILTAEYGSSSLTAVEARIWINRDDLAITPANFNWTGSFDGASAGAQFGYAGIQPKNAGTFYTGLQSGNNTWAGPFSLVLGDNSVLTNYTARQYMEFSVNLTKLGLDYARMFGGDDCAMPFRRLMAKTRASTSFSAELKDFVAPFDFFLAPRANIETQTPLICDTGSIANIYITNPISTSVYQWSTLNGNIVGPTNGTSITVDTPGTYIVTQYLQAGCSVYATDTITIGRFPNCDVLKNNLLNFSHSVLANAVQLHWNVQTNEFIKYFDLQRSYDGINFETITRIKPDFEKINNTAYFFTDFLNFTSVPKLYYRLSMKSADQKITNSHILHIQFSTPKRNEVFIYPNPLRDDFNLQLFLIAGGKVDIKIIDASGQIVNSIYTTMQKGFTTKYITTMRNQPRGIYTIYVNIGGDVIHKKLLVLH